MEHQPCSNPTQTRSLTPEETTNPFPVIENFFQTWHLAECRAMLREILHQAFSGYSTRESMNPADMLRFWEELERVTEAVWVIGERHKAEQKQ